MRKRKLLVTLGIMALSLIANASEEYQITKKPMEASILAIQNLSLIHI